MKKILLIVLLIAGLYQWQLSEQQISEQPTSVAPSVNAAVPELIETTSDSSLRKAFENRQSDIQIEGSGKVLKMLSDDNEGSRHQRFILKLSSGQTLLVAHNIDLAPRIASLSVGDTVHFFGEYEWNSKGGVIHWTHHDPNGRHIGGWLIHNGRKYQ